MKLDFLEDMTAGGRYKNVVSENLIRLYDFTPKEVGELRALITRVIIEKGEKLDLTTLGFITRVNCTLVFQIHSENIGLVKSEESYDFVCYLSTEGYREMISIMEPFETNNARGYNWIEIAETKSIDFLISPRGGW